MHLLQQPLDIISLHQILDSNNNEPCKMPACMPTCRLYRVQLRPNIKK